MWIIDKSVLALVALGLTSPPAVAQALTKCNVGRQVIDAEDKVGVIVSEGGNLCQVKYADGLIYGRIYWNLRSVNMPEASPPRLPALPSAPTSAFDNGAVAPTILLRPAPNQTLTYFTDARGQIMIPARVNGASVRFLVDTGASLVFLSARDARAAGFNRSELVFDRRAQTANGPAEIAPVLLHDVRIEQLVVKEVSAAVIENLDVSVLGMSFLARLKGFEMKSGALTIKW
jgi:aspartyl protease family protein